MIPSEGSINLADYRSRGCNANLEGEMGILDGKTAIIFGVANERSIAWGIAKAFHAQGAEIGLSYASAALKRRVYPLAEQINCRFVEQCDVASDEQIQKVAQNARDAYNHVDILVHSIGFAPRETLSGSYSDVSRADFHTTMDISVYSFTAIAKTFHSLIPEGGALLTMTYFGSDKVAPHYNVMGVAKAALEASVRYLAYDLGPNGVRVNAIAAGPIRTLAASGISGFKTMYRQFSNYAPLHQNVTIEDVGKAATFLCSDLAARITGQILFVDSGYNILGFRISHWSNRFDDPN
jgi:enoyl-[acyl-carrier protein] reductase I